MQLKEAKKRPQLTPRKERLIETILRNQERMDYGTRYQLAHLKWIDVEGLEKIKMKIDDELEYQFGMRRKLNKRYHDAKRRESSTF